MLIWKIAWRNVFRHKGKSLVIGTIIFLGALLMTVGNAVIEGAKQGLEENMVDRFTGHLVLASAEEKKDSVFFAEEPLKVLPNYPLIKEQLRQQEFIESFLPMTRGEAQVLNPDGRAGETYLFGVNFEDYQRVFHDNVTAIEGRLLQNGERGLLISDKSREDMFTYQNFWVIPEGSTLIETHLTEKAREKKERLKTKDHLVLMGFNDNDFGTDIRLPVKGIFRFQTWNEVWRGINLMDIESFRECFGYLTAADNTIELSAEEQALMTMDAMDDLFAETDVVEDVDTGGVIYDLETMQAHTQRTEAAVNPDNGVYNLVAIKLQPEMSIEEGQVRLQEIFTEAQAEIKVLTWEQACLDVAQFATMTQGALVVFVFFIFFVAILVIMNTLSMAAIERTAEIGMMRAIGAKKGFVSQMFFAETFLLSLMFGGMGILTGILLSWGLAALNIAVTQNDLLNLMLGGDTLHPIITAGEMVSGIIQLMIVTLLAMLYPILVARKITPLEAISRD